MDLKHINTLRAVMDSDSFLNASYKLGCTQSTVTMHIQQLEKTLNLKLFERVGRKMMLTQEAKEIMPYLDSIIKSVDGLMNHYKSSEEITGKLNIATAETFLVYKMQNILKEFKEKAPNVEISIQGTNCYEVRKKLLNGDIDLGIHYDINRYSDSIITKIMKKFDLILVSSSSINRKYLDFVSENQEKPFSVVGHNVKSPYRGSLLKYLENKNIMMHKTLELGSVEAAKQGIIANLGIAYLPRFTVERELKEGQLIELEHEIEQTKIKAIYAYHKNKHINRAMNLFIELLNKNFDSV